MKSAAPRTFSRRAVHRLRIANTLLHGEKSVFDGDAAACERVLAEVNQLAPEQRERLRSDVDWDESYENAEARLEVVHRRCG